MIKTLLLLALTASSPFAHADPSLDRLTEIEREYAESDLDAHMDISPAEMAARNKELKRVLQGEFDNELLEPGMAMYSEGARDLFKEFARHPVASYSLRKVYDPEGRIGFCFGRAMAIHLELLRAGIDKRSIRKIWAVGDLALGSLKWHHHVATMVRASDGGWWVIDPMWEGPMKATQWMFRMRWLFAKWPRLPKLEEPRLRFFVTRPERFGTELAVKYKREELFNEESYGSFFKDLMKHNRERPRIERPAKLARPRLR